MDKEKFGPIQLINTRQILFFSSIKLKLYNWMDFCWFCLVFIKLYWSNFFLCPKQFFSACQLKKKHKKNSQKKFVASEFDIGETDEPIIKLFLHGKKFSFTQNFINRESCFARNLNNSFSSGVQLPHFFLKFSVIKEKLRQLYQIAS